MEHCHKLKEYAQFVGEVRKRLDRGARLEEAADEAVTHCIKEGILAEFLIAHRAEVNEVILTEYDEQFHIASEKELSRQEGLNQGLELGLKALIEAYAELGIPRNKIVEKLEEKFSLSKEASEEHVKKYLSPSK